MNENLEKLETFLSQLPKNLDIICLSETRTNENNVKYVSMPGYSYFYKHSKSNAGGSGIDVSKNLIVSELKNFSLECEDSEDVWLNVSLPDNSDLVVGTIYRHPNTDLSSFEQAFTKTLKHLRSNQSYVVMGDFNVDCNKYISIAKIQHYVNSITSIDSEQLVTVPTRITSPHESIIDHIYVNRQQRISCNAAVLHIGISDH